MLGLRVRGGREGRAGGRGDERGMKRVQGKGGGERRPVRDERPGEGGDHKRSVRVNPTFDKFPAIFQIAFASCRGRGARAQRERRNHERPPNANRPDLLSDDGSVNKPLREDSLLTSSRLAREPTSNLETSPRDNQRERQISKAMKQKRTSQFGKDGRGDTQNPQREKNATSHRILKRNGEFRLKRLET